jgi:pyrroloquinoline-quinone synthase
MSGSAAEFEARLRGILDARYHHRHPFNLRMHAGALTRDELRAWVKSRYYYQTRIPIKDSAIVEKSSDRAFRRAWSERIHDHRGRRPGEGGLERWLDLAEAVGLDRTEVESLRDISPGVRAACDDYVAFVESHDLLESVASSLTELSAAEIMKVRIAAFEKHYPWVEAKGLRYFQSRTVQAKRDAQQGMGFVLRHARSDASPRPERRRPGPLRSRPRTQVRNPVEPAGRGRGAPAAPAPFETRPTPVRGSGGRRAGRASGARGARQRERARDPGALPRRIHGGPPRGRAAPAPS